MDKKPQNIMDTLTPVPTEADRKRIMPGNGVKFGPPTPINTISYKRVFSKGINRSQDNLK